MYLRKNEWFLDNGCVSLEPTVSRCGWAWRAANRLESFALWEPWSQGLLLQHFRLCLSLTLLSSPPFHEWGYCLINVLYASLHYNDCFLGTSVRNPFAEGSSRGWWWGNLDAAVFSSSSKLCFLKYSLQLHPLKWMLHILCRWFICMLCITELQLFPRYMRELLSLWHDLWFRILKHLQHILYWLEPTSFSGSIKELLIISLWVDTFEMALVSEYCW